MYQIAQLLLRLLLQNHQLLYQNTYHEEEVELSGTFLGFLQQPEHEWSLLRQHFPSKAGGTPAWLDPVNLPVGDSSLCGICGEPLRFMLQVSAPLTHDENTFHRTIFVFVCPSMSCLRRDQHEQWKHHPEKGRRSVKVFRCQLPRNNQFYSSEQPKKDGTDKPLGAAAPLCSWCGTWKRDKVCGNCKKASYCSKSHQINHWRPAHKRVCRSFDLTVPASMSVFTNSSADIPTDDSNVKWPEFELYGEDESEFDVKESKGVVYEKANPTQTEDEDDAKSYAYFLKRIAPAPDQVIRHTFDVTAKPLWPMLSGQPSKDVIPKCTSCGGHQPSKDVTPKCTSCGGHRVFEFQKKKVKEAQKKPETLGAAGLALHYANLVTQMDNIASRPISLPPNMRDNLYNGLPANVKIALRSRLQALDPKEVMTMPQIKAEMEKTLQWLVPVATDTTKAHQGFGWVGEWANTGNEFGKKTAGSNNIIRLQTLYHADKQKMDRYILDLIIWLHRLISLVRFRDKVPKYIPARSPPTSNGLLRNSDPSRLKANGKPQRVQISLEDRNLLEKVMKRRMLVPGISKSQEFVVVKKKRSSVFASSRSMGTGIHKHRHVRCFGWFRYRFLRCYYIFLMQRFFCRFEVWEGLPGMGYKWSDMLAGLGTTV